METTTFDVASSAARLKEALDEGRIGDDQLADVVLERINRVKGVDVVTLEDPKGVSEDIKASSSWTHTWRWLV